MAHIRKIKNTIKVKILAIDKTALLTKTVIGKKELDVSIWNISFIIGQHNINGYLCKKVYN